MRNRPFNALIVLLERIRATNEPSLALDASALEDARELAEAIDSNSGDTDAWFVLGWLHWYRFIALPSGKDRDALEAAIQAFMPCFATGIEPLPERLMPVLADLSVSPAEALLREALSSSDLGASSAAAALWQRILAATPADSPNLAARASNLSTTLSILFEQTGSLEQLDLAISVTRNVAAAVPPAHPDRAALLSGQEMALRARYERTGSVSDLEQAISLGRDALTTTPVDHPNRTGYLSNLGVALVTRYTRFGSEADLDEAIALGRDALANSPADHPTRAILWSNLGNALFTRYERTGVLADLDEATEIERDALAAAPSGHPNRAAILSNIGTLLWARYERLGDLQDLDDAVETGMAAASLLPGRHAYIAGRLSNLGIALLTRYERTGNLADLDQAVAVGRSAVDATPEDHPNRAMYLSNLGDSLRTRFARSGSWADLEGAVAVGRESVALTASGDPGRSGRLSNLGVSLRNRYGRTGNIADLNAAVNTAYESISAAPADHPGRAVYLSNLCAALGHRFERTGALEDLDKAIAVAHEAIAATPEGHPARAARLSNLGAAHRIRFGRTHLLDDLDQAVVVGREAVAVTPSNHRDRPLYLADLALALRARYLQTQDPADLDAAVEVGRNALATMPDDEPNRVGMLSNLGNALLTRFIKIGASTDLDEAIALGEKAVTATSGDHPNRAGRLSNLGNALNARFRLSGEQADVIAASQAFEQAAAVRTAPAAVRVRAARLSASLIAEIDVGHAAELMTAAVQLLPEAAAHWLAHGDRREIVKSFAGLAGDAAALTLRVTSRTEASRAESALSLLETGRAVLLSQALDTRTDLTELEERQPVLARRFSELRDELGGAYERDSLPSSFSEATNIGNPEPSSLMRDRHRIATEFDAVLAEIRGIDGFQTFLLPPSARQLIREASAGPLVAYNVSAYRSDALILRAGGVTAIHLPLLLKTDLIEQVVSFHRNLALCVDTTITSEARIRAQHVLTDILNWLWDTAIEPVFLALGYNHTISAHADGPQVWWAPGGLLGLLPIHAAGYHVDRRGDERRTVIDRVISSYTPTVRSLRYAREVEAAQASGQRALVVAMPTTPGAESLDNVDAEAAMLRARLQDPDILIEATATKRAVLERLASCAVAHFACHGATDAADPTANRLLLYDHESDPLTIAGLAPIRLDHALLAYLSSCSTAFNSSVELIDEAVNLTGAFQMAGFPHVIGTLWEVDDALAAQVARDFYTAVIRDDGTIDAKRIAKSLHQAVYKLRDSFPATPFLWASYIHAGA